MADIKTCIFDLDGVICDTARFHYKAWKALAQTLGFELTHAHDEQMKGIGRMQSLELILNWANRTMPLAQKEALCVEKNNCFVQSIQSIQPSDMLPGVEIFLQELKANKYKIALGSASKNAPLILEKLGITHYFDALVDGNSVSTAKPNPEVFILGAVLTNTAVQNCVVFEDAISGVQAALNAKMYVIGVGKPEVLSKAHLCISTFEHFSLNSFASL
jgi:beta-phosphoglucomutase